MKGHGNKIIAQEGSYRVLRTATMYLVQRKLPTYHWARTTPTFLARTSWCHDAVARFPRRQHPAVKARLVSFQDECAKRLMHRMIRYEALALAVANHAMRDLIVRSGAPRP